MKDKYIKFIIETLCSYLDYILTEYKFPNNKSIWGVKKKTEYNEEHILFLKSEEVEEVRNSGANLSSLNKVVVIGENENYSNYILDDKTIILDLSVNKVIHWTEESSYIAEILQRILGSIREEKKSKNKSWITFLLIGINIFAYIITALLSKNIFSSDQIVLIYLGAKVNSLIEAGQYYRLLTCAFLHGGILHIALNMTALYSIGPLVEQMFGRLEYIFIYLITAITSSLASFYFSPNVSIGASGAIFGLLGAVLVYAYKNKNKVGRSFLNNIITVIGINIFIGISMKNIDNFGHLGGLLGGIILGLILLKLKRAK